jgi:DNA-binding CsgD family transcriptional regulator
MEPFDLAQSFIERCKRTPTTGALTAAFQDVLEHLGFRYFACCSHVNPLKPPEWAVMVHNYPPQWVQAFGQRKLHEIDPVLLHAERTLLPFFWDGPEFQARTTAPQREILAEAAAVGLVHGYTIPIHMPWTAGGFRASCSVVPDARSIEVSSYFAVQLMATYLYDAASREHETRSAESPQRDLSLRERQCLELVAQGKSNWTIGQILCISEHTVHRHIESAKQRLGVATRVQAVIGALQGHQISIGDAIRADPGAP